MRKKLKMSYELVMVLILILMIAVFGLMTDGAFFKPSIMIGCTADVAYLGVQAMAMTLIILTAGIDLSVSYQMVCSAMVCAWTFNKLSGAMGMGTVPTILIAIVACVLSGFVFGGINGHHRSQDAHQPLADHHVHHVHLPGHQLVLRHLLCLLRRQPCG